MHRRHCQWYTGTEIEQQPYEALSVLDDLIRANVNSHGEDVALILGCAGMTELHQELSSRWAHLNIIDPVASGLVCRAFCVRR